MQVDLNADLGEGFGPWKMGDDAALMDIITTANVACGFHAGDPAIMRRTVIDARARGVAVGAHPGYADLAGFGRRAMPGITAHEIEELVAVQVGALGAICALENYPMTHVKTHGALGNACADDDALAAAVARAIKAVDPDLCFIVMPGTATERAAERLGLRAIREVYADRTYADSFNLTPRSQPDAMIHDPSEALARVLDMVENSRIVSTSGKILKAGIDSICVHGDGAQAVAMALALRRGLEAANVAVRSPVRP
ncbi:5-oxoprolinase subunit PxpA [Mesorhizobium sp. 8]|uniref:LamB/YcsF family protein n=1 Tax=Mesorhizobium sp. 8 TaxID=2584466 RepID=UPI00112037B1|nr:5-oxoprolinase subunit PxpA [Mesorhizobium sp. 8]QDC00674.1 LamB/YcsF family protein [Mesorhizobium sp. 8]